MRKVAGPVVALLVACLAVLPVSNAQEQRDVQREHVIYVPFDELKGILLRPGDSVVLSYEEYQALRRKAEEADLLRRGPARVTAILEQANYDAVVQDQQVRVGATWHIRSVREGWSGLLFHLGDGRIASFQSPRPDLLIRSLGGGNYELLTYGAGESTVELEFSFRVVTEPGVQYANFFFPAAGVASLQLRVPETDLSFRLSPEILFETEAVEDATVLRADVGGLTELTVTWFPRSEGVEGARLLTAETLTTVAIGGGTAETEAKITYRILRGAVNELRIAVPSGARVLEVESPEIQSWEVLQEDGKTVVRAKLYRDVRDTFTVRLRMDETLGEGPLSVGQVVPLDAVRGTGVIAVRGLEELLLTPVELQNSVQVTPEDIPEELQQAGQLFFRFYSPEFVVRIDVRPIEPWIRVQSLTDLRASRTAWHVITRATVDIQRAGTFRLTLVLPADMTVREVVCEQLDRYDVRPLEDGQELTITFKNRVAGTLSLELQGTMPFDAPASTAEWQDVELRVPEFSGTRREDSLVRVLTPEFLEVVTRPQRSRNVRPLGLGDLEDPSVLPGPPTGLQVTGLYAVTGHPVVIALSVRRRPPRVEARAFSLLQVHQKTVSVRTTVDYNIRYSGVREFRLAVPATIASVAHVEGENIREHRFEPLPDSEDEQLLIVQLQADQIGQYRLMLEYELPLTSVEPGEAEEIAGELVWQPPRVLGVEREHGEIGLTRDEELSLVGQSTGAESIDPRELTLAEPNTGIRLAYRYFSHPVTITLRVARPRVQPVVETVIDRSLIEVVVPQEGAVGVNAVYKLKTTERQRLEVWLPEGARILSVQVNGRTVLPELVPGGQQDDLGRIAYLVDVTREQSVDEPLYLGVAYETGHEILSMWGSWSAVYPGIKGNVATDEQFLLCWFPQRWQPLDVAGFDYVRLTLFDLLGLATPGHFPDDVEELRERLPNGFSRVGSGQRFGLYRSFNYRDSSRGRYIEWTPAYLGTSGLVLLAAIGLLAFSWELRLSVVALALLGLSSLHFARPEYALVLGTAAVPGTGLGLGLWVFAILIRIPGHLGQRLRKRTSEAETQSTQGPGSPEVQPDSRGSDDATASGTGEAGEERG